MNRPSLGASAPPFSLHPAHIWDGLAPHERRLLAAIYRLDQALKRGDLPAAPGTQQTNDDWRWLPCTRLETYAQETDPNERELPATLRKLETRGLIRCRQERWSADDRLYVRILFLGQRVVRAGGATA